MRENDAITAGMVGSGFAAALHMKSLHRMSGTEAKVVGVYSPTRRNREDFARKYRIRAFDSPEALMDEVEVVHVCTPPYVHEEIAVEALRRGKYPVVEKPLTGYFGDGSEDFNGDSFPRQDALEGARRSIRRILEAERESEARLLYAENWVYIPAVEKEREILEKTGAQVLWMHAEESHSGSHSEAYGFWKYSGGGSMIGKGCHPLAAALYLKRVEGLTTQSGPIRPAAISAHAHALTRMENFRDEGHLRTGYHDIEDFSAMHVTFEDGTVADIFASELVMGGIHDWIEVCANNHRTRCNINPNDFMETYNPVEESFRDVWTVEKIGTRQGWSKPCPDDHWFSGYTHEMEDFYRCVATGERPQSDSGLAADCVATIYAGYVSAERTGREVEIECPGD